MDKEEWIRKEGCKDTWIQKFEFVAKTFILFGKNENLQNVKNKVNLFNFILFRQVALSSAVSEKDANLSLLEVFSFQGGF